MQSRDSSNRRPMPARYEVDLTQVDSWMQDPHHQAFRRFVHVVLDTKTGFVCGLKVSRTPLSPLETVAVHWRIDGRRFDASFSVNRTDMKQAKERPGVRLDASINSAEVAAQLIASGIAVQIASPGVVWAKSPTERWMRAMRLQPADCALPMHGSDDEKGPTEPNPPTRPSGSR